MKKYLILFLIASLFISCNQTNKPASVKTTITVSILPQKYMVQQIAGEEFNIMVLVPDGSGPETYEPTARQMQEISVSKACYITGLLDFEKSWIPKVSEIYPELKVVNLSDGLSLIKGEEHASGEEYMHEAEGAGAHHHGGIDPHIWLSIKEMKLQSKTVLASLQSIAPDKKDLFEKNYNWFIQHLDSVDKVITDKIKNAGTKVSYIIYHPSLSYYSRDYGVEQIAIELEGKEPSPAYMKELIDIANEKGTTTIFYSQQFDKKSAETISKQLSVGLSEFNPLAFDVPANLLDFTEKLVKTTNK